MQGGAAADAADQQKGSAFVEALTDFDKRMNQVVVDSGILQGIPEGRLRSAGAPILSFKTCPAFPAVASSKNRFLALPCPALPCLALPCPAVSFIMCCIQTGEQIGLQPGCLTVLSRAQELGVPTHILSVNYSSEMVKAALQRGALKPVIS